MGLKCDGLEKAFMTLRNLVDLSCGASSEPAILHCHLQAAGKHVDDLAHTRRRLRLGEATSPYLHRAVGQRPERVATERGLDVVRDNAASSFL